MAQQIRYRTDLAGVDWVQLKALLSADRFDNGRSAEQLRTAFENSQAVVLAQTNEAIVGTARALSDGISNAYVIDVWTHSPLRRRGIGRAMMERLLARLQGQHVYLFSDDFASFYKTLGFVEQPVGLGRVVGTWLEPDGTRTHE